MTDGCWLGSDTNALQLDTRFGAPGGGALPLLLNHVCIRVIRVIRGEIISVFPGRVFEKRDRSEEGPIADGALEAPA